MNAVRGLNCYWSYYLFVFITEGLDLTLRKREAIEKG